MPVPEDLVAGGAGGKGMCEASFPLSLPLFPRDGKTGLAKRVPNGVEIPALPGSSAFQLRDLEELPHPSPLYLSFLIYSMRIIEPLAQCLTIIGVK